MITTAFSTSISAPAIPATVRCFPTSCCTITTENISLTLLHHPAPANCTKGTASHLRIWATTAAEDLLEEVGGAVPGDRHAFRLFKNPGNDNDWITVHLVGVKSNRSAIGARIKVTVQDGDQAPRSIYRTVGSGGSFGASPLQQHIGLGKSARILNLEIWWPASQTHQNFTDVNKNQFIEIKEFEKSFTVLQRRNFQLPAPKHDEPSTPATPGSATSSSSDSASRPTTDPSGKK